MNLQDRVAIVTGAASGIGAETVRLLSDVARGDRSQLPMFQVMKFSCDPVTKENVAALRQKLPHRQVASTMPAVAAPK